MIRVARAALLCLFALPAILGAQEKYLASYAGFAGFQAPLWSAKDFGFLAKYGVNTDLVMIPGSARGAQALLSRRMRSLGVTMSVRRMPNFSLTTTTSPCAIR